MSVGIIYKVRNIVNNKLYIGQTTKGFYYRRRCHIKAMNNGSPLHFHRALRKHGVENFQWHIIFKAECHRNKLNELEKFFIAYYGSFNFGYNMTEGGETSPLKEHPQKREIYERIVQKKRTINPETGLDSYQRGTLKQQFTKSCVDRATGLTINQLISIKRDINMKTVDAKSGLTKYQMAGLKTSKTMKTLGTINGGKNPNAKRFLLIAPNGQMIGAFGNLKEKCQKYNLSFKRMYYVGLKIKNAIPPPRMTSKTSQKSLNCTGWKILSV